MDKQSIMQPHSQHHYQKLKTSPRNSSAITATLSGHNSSQPEVFAPTQPITSESDAAISLQSASNPRNKRMKRPHPIEGNSNVPGSTTFGRKQQTNTFEVSNTLGGLKDVLPSQGSARNHNGVEESTNETAGRDAASTSEQHGFSFVSVSPTKRQMVDQHTLKHIRFQQQKDKQNWRGLNIEYTGRPGMAHLQQQHAGQNSHLNESKTTKKHFAKIVEYFKMEDERFKYFFDCINKNREIEEEKLLMEPVPKNKDAEKALLARELALGPKPSEILNCKPPKDLQLLVRDGVSIMTYSRPPGYMDQANYDFQYKMIKADAKVVRAVCETNNFGLTENNDWNLCWSSQSYKPNVYDSLQEYQKINHFPNSHELTHKAKLIANVIKMQEKFGKEAFSIVPDSYILPDEFADFYSHFHSLRSKEQPNMWIIKPQNSCQGKGIYIIDDISEVPIDESCIISRYIPNPLLINGLKFDLRVYVLITCMDPWRIYVYHEGLTRFAVEPYSEATTKNARGAHLTNFSLNKKNEKFINNQSAEMDDMGHKWSLSALNKHLEQLGIDMELVWSRIYDLIIKSLLCVDSQIQQGLRKMGTKNSCFEVLGYDVLIDSDLKPWLMEVNLSPSLATESPLDLKIKSNLFLDSMNLICIKKHDKQKNNLKNKNRTKSIIRQKQQQQTMQSKMAGSSVSQIMSAGQQPMGGVRIQMPGDERRQKFFGVQNMSDEIVTAEERNWLVIDKICQLNSRLREIVRETLVENQRKSNFIRIYPCKGCDQYDNYFSLQKPLHRMVYRCLFSNEIVPFPLGYPISEPSLPLSQNTFNNQTDASLQNANQNPLHTNQTPTKLNPIIPQTPQVISTAHQKSLAYHHSGQHSLAMQQQQKLLQQSSSKDAENNGIEPKSASTNGQSLNTSFAYQTPQSISYQQSFPTHPPSNYLEQQPDLNDTKSFQNQQTPQKFHLNARPTHSSILNETDPHELILRTPNASISVISHQNQQPVSSDKLTNSSLLHSLSPNKEDSAVTTASKRLSAKKSISNLNGLTVGCSGIGIGIIGNTSVGPVGCVNNGASLLASGQGQRISIVGEGGAFGVVTNGNSGGVVNGGVLGRNKGRSQMRSPTLPMTGTGGSCVLTNTSSTDVGAAAAVVGAGRDKLLITGDDVLIEYVHRLMMAVQSIKESMFKPQWKIQIEKFIKHYVWHSSDVRRTANNSLWQRLESRLIEMKERRKRLLQSIYLKERGERNQESNLPLLNEAAADYQTDFLREFEAKEAQKNVIIQGFSAHQLEDMLRTSTRNLAYEVISCLIDEKGNGVLTEIIKFLTSVNKQYVLETGFSSFLDGNQRKRQSYGKHHLQSSQLYNPTESADPQHQVRNQFITPHRHHLNESDDDTEGYLHQDVNHPYKTANGVNGMTNIQTSINQINNSGQPNSQNSNSKNSSMSVGSTKRFVQRDPLRIRMRKQSQELTQIQYQNNNHQTSPSVVSGVLSSAQSPGSGVAPNSTANQQYQQMQQIINAQKAKQTGAHVNQQNSLQQSDGKRSIANTALSKEHIIFRTDHDQQNQQISQHRKAISPSGDVGASRKFNKMMGQSNIVTTQQHKTEQKTVSDKQRMATSFQIKNSLTATSQQTNNQVTNQTSATIDSNIDQHPHIFQQSSNNSDQQQIFIGQFAVTSSATGGNHQGGKGSDANNTNISASHHRVFSGLRSKTITQVQNVEQGQSNTQLLRGENAVGAAAAGANSTAGVLNNDLDQASDLKGPRIILNRKSQGQRN